MLNVTFFGVLAVPTVGGGSRYGGHTSCVALEVSGRDSVVLDLGTGVERWASRRRAGTMATTHALLSRVDPDRVAGLASLPQGLGVEVYGPPPHGRRLADAVADAVGARLASATAAPPGPAGPGTASAGPAGPGTASAGPAGPGRAGLGTASAGPAGPGPAGPGDRGDGLRFVAVEDEVLAVGDAKVTVRSPPDAGGANGYRVDWEGVSVAYVVDRRSPAGADVVPHQVLELADGVDLLIHGVGPDADGALLVAREAGARCLALFHHDPGHDDDRLDRLLAVARRTAERLGVDEVIAAAEGTTVSFDR